MEPRDSMEEFGIPSCFAAAVKELYWVVKANLYFSTLLVRTKKDIS